jgi:hypothetical protein
MVGVLTIISLLAAAVISQMIRRIDRAAWEKEKLDQQAMADAYTRYILRNKSITNYPGIPGAIAKQMAWPLSGITQTPRGWNRVFLVDPNFTIGGGKSYTQGTNGTAQPANARIMILSSIAGNLPVSVVSSDNNADFQAIWDTADGAKPATSTWTTWNGKGEDLLIKKLNLEPLFYQLLLCNNDSTAAIFSIDSTNNLITLQRGSPCTNSYYLDGTVLGLYDCKGGLLTQYLLQRSIGFVFESCAWRGQIQGSGIETNNTSISAMATNFVNTASLFYSKPTNPAASSQGASQTSVLVAMYTFMFDYVFWATECPHFDYHNYSTNNAGGLPEYDMLNDNSQTSGRIDAFSGAGGLLNPR